MRVGIIGLGSIGTRHAKNALALGHEVLAFDPREHSSDDPWTWCADIYTLLDLKPEAVLICTPASSHATQARELLDIGYNAALFCEKPLALSVADCAVFQDWPHPTTMVGYNLRFHPTARHFKSVGGWSYGMFSCECENAKYGNDLFELSHEIDLALWLGVDPTPWGLDGFADHYYRQWSVWTDDDTTTLEAEFFSPEALGTQMYVDELAHFLDCVAKGIPTITPFADGIRVVSVCEDAMKMVSA